MNREKTFKFYSDDGHGWLAVKRADLAEFGLLDKISHYSYQRGDTVYLEEDCDAPKFDAMFRKTFDGAVLTSIGSHKNGRSPIRSYDSFDGND